MTGDLGAWKLHGHAAPAVGACGEDEAGELYVVGLGGSLSKLVSSGPCTYAIAPTSRDLGAGTAAGSVAVTAGGGCTWTAVSNAPSWLHVTSGASGTGNGTVGYSVDAYTGKPKNRKGTLTIAGRTFTVKQTR